MHFNLAAALICFALAADAVAQVPRSDGPSAIFVMRLDGSRLRRLAEVEGYRDHGSPRWSHDGKQLAFDAARADSAARRWFVVNADGSGLRAMGLGARADWSPDDKQLVFAVGGEAPATKGIWVQNVDGRGRLSLAVGGDSPRWSPRGGELALIDGDALAIVDLVASGHRKLQVPGGIVAGFDWSRDGGQLAIVTGGDGERDLRIVDFADADNKKKLLSGNLGAHPAWSPDANRLAIVIAGRLHVLNVDGSGTPEPIPGQEGNNRMPAWSADGEWIAFVSTRKTPAPAPVASKKRSLRVAEVKRHTPGAIIYGLALSPDGRKAYLGLRSGLQIWDAIQDNTTTLDFIRGQAIALSSDGRTLASCGTMIKVELADVENGKLLRDLPCGGMCTSTSFSSDGRRLVASLQNHQAIVWDVPRRKQLCVFKNHTAPVTRVAFLSSGEEVASNGQDKMLRVWNARTAQQRLAIAHPDAVWGLAVSPDGRLIATGTGGNTVGNPISQRLEVGKDNLLRLWDAASGDLVREMKGHTNAVFALDFSPDGRTLASGGWDGTVRLWDVGTGQQLASVQRQGSAFVVAFTPDGSELFVAGGENRSAGATVQRFPDEQVQLYRIVEANASAQPSAR